MAQAKFNFSEAAADPTENLQTDDVYLNDGTLTANGKPGFRRYTGSVWEDVGGNGAEMEVYNNSGAEIVIEKVVYISGFHVGSDLPTIALADHNSAGAEEAIGISHEAIANNASGHITVGGITPYPTTGMSVGDDVYVSDTAGVLTDTRPTTGIISEVGKILKIGASGNGKILVNIDGGSHIDDPINVNAANVTNPPTDAELDSAYGTPASVGNGFVSLLDDNAADTNVYLVASNGTSWWYTALTKAT